MTTWLSFVEAVSDLTKYDWEKTFAMSIMEFFAFLSYVNYKRTIEQKKLEDWKRRNRIK